MSVSRRLAFACLFLFVAAAAQAAGHAQLSISDEIGAVRVDRAEAVQGSAMLREFTPAKFERAFVLESDAVRVMLRPVGARASAPVAESRGFAYRNAFRGVDVLRSGGDTPFEAVVARDRAALESIAYEIAEMRGVIAAVPAAGGGIRFVTGNPAHDVTISAPLLVDANGRPSKSARWVVSPNGAAGHGTLRLKTGDATLRYPVKAIYTMLNGQRPSVSAPGRRFGLVAQGTGSISGAVTDSVTGAPLVDQFVVVFDSLGNFVDLQSTNSAGGYLSSGLDTGSYRVFATAADYVAELYNNIPCDACDVTTGTPVSVTNAENTGGINFALTPLLGRVTGQILAGTAPGTDVVVLFYDNTGNAAGSATADSSGFYEATMLAAGSPFKARTFNSTIPGYLDQLYNGVDCGACPLSSGTAITVSAGLTTPNINFTLHTGGQIAGSVTDTASTPIYQANIGVYDSTGVLRATTQSDLNGNYITPGGLSPGNYFVLATAFAHESELYNNISCNSCSVTTGTAVAVTAAATTGNINFSLRADDVPVSGAVTDATTAAGLANVTVLFYDSTGTQVSVGITDGTGHYSTTLADGGTYYARTDNSANPGYVEQLYNNIDCSGCNPTTGTAINATAGSPITGINFALRTNGGSISGHVSDAGTNSPVAFASVAIYSSTGTFVTHATANANGDFTSFDELTAGTYYATAGASRYATQLYSNLNCATGCVVTSGTAITVLAGQATTGIDFALQPPLARITGTVVSAADSSPIAGATVTVYDSTGGVAASVTTDVDGSWTASVSTSGTYYATAAAAGFATQLYNNHACSGCDPLTGDPITATIGGTTPSINFLLQTSGCNITVNPLTLPDGAVGQSYSETVSATGGVAPYTFTVTAGDLPDGLTLNGSTGLISGTASAAGAFLFTITASDASCSGAREYQVEIEATDTPTTTTLMASPNPATYGQSVTLTATVTPEGATGTVTFFDGTTTLGSDDLDGSGVATIAVSFNAGTHSLTASYGGAPTYAPSTSNTVSLVVNKATPVFSDLSAPVIIIHTASTTISGRLTAGSLIPPGSVDITLNGVTQTAVIQPNGTFSSTFATALLVPPSYPITFSYAGDANFNAANATSTLTVRYGTTGVIISSGGGGGSIPFRVTVYDVNNVNLASPLLTVTAYGVRLATSSTWLPAQSNGNSGPNFDYHNSSGGQYQFNLKTNNLASGNYVFGYTIGADTTIYEIPFTVN